MERYLEAGATSTMGRGSTFVTDALTCPRLWVFRHFLHQQAGASPAQAIGTALHIANAHQALRRMQPDEGWATPSQAVSQALLKGELVLDNSGRDRVLGFIQKHQMDTTLYPFQPVEVEFLAELQVNLDGYTFHYRPRLDLAMELGGKVWIVDHKTTSQWGGKGIPSQYDNHLQFLLAHAIGTQRYGDKFGGVMIHKIQTVPPYAESWDPMVIQPHSVMGALESLSVVAGMTRDMEIAIAVRDPLPLYCTRGTYNEMVCHHRYGRCSAWDACRSTNLRNIPLD